MTVSGYAPQVFRALNGVATFYKPLGYTGTALIHEIRSRIADQLNELKVRPIATRLEITGGYGESKKLKTVLNWGDHPAVVGPRYVPWEIPIFSFNTVFMSNKTSGVAPIIIGSDAIKLYSSVMKRAEMLNVFHIRATLGYATNTHFDDGAIIDRTNFKMVKRHSLDRVLDKITSDQRNRLFDATKTPLDSQEAYLLAQSWPSIPPKTIKWPVIYDLRCVAFNSPDFEIQVTANRSKEDYLAQLINDIGQLLKNSATVKSIRKIKCGPFVSESSLCDQEWDLQSIINNINANKQHMQVFSVESNCDSGVNKCISHV